MAPSAEFDNLHIGVDPGAAGGLAMLQEPPSGGHPVPTDPCIAMPLKGYAENGGKGEGPKDFIDPVKVEEYLYFAMGAVPNPAFGFYIERVHAMPGQGVSSTFRFGELYGGIRGALETLVRTRNFPYPWWIRLVEPKAWKSYHGLINKPKPASMQKATELYGEGCRERFWPMKKHQGIAEAALIAHYGWSLMQS